MSLFISLSNTHKCSKKSKIGRVIFAFECQRKDETNRCNSKHQQYPLTDNTISYILNSITAAVARIKIYHSIMHTGSKIAILSSMTLKIEVYQSLAPYPAPAKICFFSYSTLDLLWENWICYIPTMTVVTDFKSS